jgi:hypothetical protein
MQNFSKLSALFASAFLLSACEPAFETTAQKCAAGQDIQVVIPAPDPKFQIFTDADEYPLYLREAIETMAPSSVLSAEEQAAKDFIDQQISDFLSYDKSGDLVTGARNPLDFLESIVSTTDPGVEIEAFAIAKNQVAQGIADDDDFCSYQNDDIRIVDTDADATTLAFAELAMSYNPFTRIVQQSIIVAEQREDLESSASRESVPFIGFYQALPENFKANGFTQPEVRQLIANNGSGFARLSFDDGEDTELGQLLLDYNNEYCDTDRTNDDPSTWEDCPSGTTTRVPSTDVGGACDAEANKLEEHSFDLNSVHTDLKRLRVEVDYTSNKAGEVRIYISEYREAIYGADANGLNQSIIIKDPTDCEKQAVLDLLADANPGVGVRLTFVTDTGYDITYETDADGEPVLDSDGNQIISAEPIPAYTYQGTAGAIIP